MRYLFYVILLAGFGNTVLRPEIENPYTLYRMLAPIGLIALFCVRPMLVLKAAGLFALFVAYNFILAARYSSDFSQLLPSLVHYLYIYVILVLMIDMRTRYTNFDNQYLRFLQGFYIFLLLNMFIELLFGAYYPNLEVDETGESIIRTFYWSQNDLAVVLGVVLWIVLTLDRFKGPVRRFVVPFTIWALYYNDSKAALLSVLLLSLPIFAIFKICSTVRIDKKVWYFLFSGVFASVAAILISVSDVDINFANDTYTLGDLLVGPITNIINLQSSGEVWGSVNNRTDAAIFGIIEYLRSSGFGLGAGGSWLVLTLPQYELGGAKSPHNALLQFVVDFGYPVLLGYLYLVYWALRRLFRYRLAEPERLKVMAVLSFPLLGLSQSGAIVTNYFFWAGIFFIFLYGRPRPGALRRPAATRVESIPFTPGAQTAAG